MGQSDGKTPAGEPEDPHSRPAEGGHVSFVQRLARHFGEGVDPRIDLQADEGAAVAHSDPPSAGSSTTVQDFVKRLRPTLESGSRYSIKNEVASGGMGTILRVWDEDLRRNLAMKVMHGSGSGSSVSDGSGSVEVDPERLGRFLEEAQITGQLDHPGVVPVHDLGIDSKGRCYFTMRFVRGRELKEVFDLAKKGQEGWTRTKVLGVVLKVCEAMAYAHSKGVVHRDLKPSNVMVGRFGETYVMDWGLARVVGRHDSHDLRLKPRSADASALSLVRTVRKDESESNPESPLVTMDGDVIGTPSYMAPEQARGKLEQVGPRSDVYSLGAMLYYMLTGEPPYVKPGERLSPHSVLSRVLDGPPTPIAKLAPDEPEELIAIAEKAMAREAEQRYGSMLELADDLQAFLENRVVRAYERGSLAEFKKWVVRNKGMAAGLAGMLVLGVASAIGFAWQQKLENERLSELARETDDARREAEHNLTLAQASEQSANENLTLARDQQAEASRQAELARRKEQDALRSGYVANLLAADYSLRLNDLTEARARLSDSVTALRGFEWQHLSLQANAPIRDLGDFTNLEAVAVMPDGERAAFLTSGGLLTFKSLATGRPVPPANLAVRTREIGSFVQRLFTNLELDVDPSGEHLVVSGASPELVEFDLEAAESGASVEPRLFAGHRARSSAVAYSPNGRRLASGDDEGELLVRDAVTGDVERRLSGHVGPVLTLAWSPDSARLASSGRDGAVILWDASTGERVSTMKGHRGNVRGLVFDLEGEYLFSCGEDGGVHRWDTRTGSLLASFEGHEGPVHALDYDPGHEVLVTAGEDHTVRLWNVRTGAARVLRGHAGSVHEVRFDPRGERLISSEKGMVYLWDALVDPAVTELDLHRRGILAMAWDPSGTILATASEEGDVVLWDTQAGLPLRRLRGGHSMFVNGLSFGPDGKRLLTGSQDKTARVWDVETGRPLQRLGAFERWVDAVLYLPDGHGALIATGDKKVRVIDLDTLTVRRELAGFQGPVKSIELSADGQQILTRSDRELMLWSIAQDVPEPLLVRRNTYAVAALLPDGRTLVTGTEDGLMQLWATDSDHPRASQSEKIRRLTALELDPVGRRVVTAIQTRTGEQELRIRDAETMQTLHTLRGGDAAIRVLAFSPDGSRLATALADGRVRIHETGGVEARRARQREAAALTDSAARIVEELFAERFLEQKVLAALAEDDALPHALREVAVRLTQLRGDDPLPLLERSLEECLEEGASPEVYQRAHARARAAAELDGSGGVPSWELEALTGLSRGAASLRVGENSAAEELLARERSAPLGQATLGLYGARERALRQLFLCLAQCGAEKRVEAESSWRVAQQSVLSDVALAQRPELLALMGEVERRLAPRATGS